MDVVVRGSSRFHLYCTHAGPLSVPVEKDPAGRAQLNRILNIVAAKARPLPSGVQLPRSAVIDAYARLGVIPSDMPNTARLLTAEARHRGLEMTAVLIDDAPETEGELRAAFSAFRVFGGSWQKPLARLRSYDAPWVLSVAPPKVVKRDLRALGDHLRDVLTPAGFAGVVCVLGRNLDARGRESFWEAMVDGFDGQIEIVAVAAAKGRVHAVGMASKDGDPVAEAALIAHETLTTVDVL